MLRHLNVEHTRLEFDARPDQIEKCKDQTCKTQSISRWFTSERFTRIL